MTEARPDYQGSITIDADLLEKTGMRPNDAVLVANCESGARFETYIFRGEPGSGTIAINGAAAHLAAPGDRVIIIHFAYMNEEESSEHQPTVLLMNEDNTVREILNYDAVAF